MPRRIPLLIAILFILTATSPVLAGGQPPMPQPPPTPTVQPVTGGQLTWWRAVWTVEGGIRGTRISLRGFPITKPHPPVIGWRLTCQLWKTHERITCDNYPRYAVIAAHFPASIQQWAGIIYSKATAHGLDPNLVAAVVEQESRGNPNAYSEAAAVGLMQLTPIACADEHVNVPYSWMWDPAWNIEAGTRLLAWYIYWFGSEWNGTAAYFGGYGFVYGYDAQQYAAAVFARRNGIHSG